MNPHKIKVIAVLFLIRKASLLSDFATGLGLTVAALTDLVSIAPREKVVRIALASLRNLAVCSADQSPPPAGSNDFDGVHFLSEMIACGLMKAVDHLRDRQFTDPDIIDGKLVWFLLVHCILFLLNSLTLIYPLLCVV